MEISLVLVPVDFSDCSANALRYAKKMTDLWKAELLLIHVIDSKEVNHIADYTKESIDNVRERLTNRAKQTFRHFLKNLNLNNNNLVKDTIVSYGSPFQEIAIKARELQIDLILMGGYGSKGKGLIDEIFFGGTVDKVVRLLPCPVLCVPMGWPTESV
jgi:universal stress protein A